jgi:hypothetical protein
MFTKTYIMKKFTFLLATSLISLGMFAQQTLSHSVDQSSLGGGLACASNPDQVPNSGDEGVSDNFFYRAYTPSDFDFTGDFEAMGIGFVAEFTDVGGTDPTVTSTVRLFTSSDVFPAGTLTEIASKSFDVTAADDGVPFEVMFDTPVIVDSSTELIVAIDIAANPGPPGNYDFRIGVNDLGQADPSYLTSTACGLTSVGTFAAIGFPDNHMILNLLGDSTLGTDNFALSQISIFPNPTNDVLKVTLPSNLELINATLFDLVGKNSGVKFSDGLQADVSNLSSGIYILKIETTGGILSQKVIIK